jgi:hypothetical protein
MNPPVLCAAQWTVEIAVDAPLKRVWEVAEDVTLIPNYHPEVDKLVGGRARVRAGDPHRVAMVTARARTLTAVRARPDLPRKSSRFRASHAKTVVTWTSGPCISRKSLECPGSHRGHCAVERRVTIKYKGQGGHQVPAILR